MRNGIGDQKRSSIGTNQERARLPHRLFSRAAKLFKRNGEFFSSSLLLLLQITQDHLLKSMPGVFIFLLPGHFRSVCQD